MAKKFEELLAWQKARSLTNAIYQICNQGFISKDFGLRNQLQRASVSTMTNIAEGFGYVSHNQFKQFLVISRASAVEVQSLLYVALDAKYIDESKFKELYNLAKDIIALTTALQNSLKS